MRNKVMTARPAARKGNGTRAEKKTVAVASTSRKSQPIVQMVERKSAPNLAELAAPTKKQGTLPIPMATFVF